MTSHMNGITTPQQCMYDTTRSMTNRYRSISSWFEAKKKGGQSAHDDTDIECMLEHALNKNAVEGNIVRSRNGTQFAQLKVNGDKTVECICFDGTVSPFETKYVIKWWSDSDAMTGNRRATIEEQSHVAGVRTPYKIAQGRFLIEEEIPLSLREAFEILHALDEQMLIDALAVKAVQDNVYLQGPHEHLRSNERTSYRTGGKLAEALSSMHIAYEKNDVTMIERYLEHLCNSPLAVSFRDATFDNVRLDVDHAARAYLGTSPDENVDLSHLCVDAAKKEKQDELTSALCDVITHTDLSNICTNIYPWKDFHQFVGDPIFDCISDATKRKLKEHYPNDRIGFHVTGMYDHLRMAIKSPANEIVSRHLTIASNHVMQLVKGEILATEDPIEIIGQLLPSLVMYTSKRT